MIYPHVLKEAHQRLNLGPATEPNFFSEWQEFFPEPSEIEQTTLNRLKARYRIIVKAGLRSRQYDISDKFTLSTRQGNQLHAPLGLDAPCGAPLLQSVRQLEVVCEGDWRQDIPLYL